LAAVIRLRVISTAGSMFMSLTSYMVPAWAALFGVFLMGETLTPNLIYALALILGGIAISQSRNFNKLFRR
jgi:drug/metabolite transporter (DMT)-like permease